MWNHIEEINWNELSQQKRGYETGKRYMMENFTQKRCGEITDFVHDRWKELNIAIDKHQDEHGRVGDYSGDDSYGDMILHVIGLGKSKFEEIMDDPSKLNGMEFVESFAYCLPYEHDFKLLKPETHREKAIGCMGDILQILAANDPSYEDINTMRDIMNRLMFMIAGDFAEAARGFNDSTYSRYYKFESNTQMAKFANVISDCKKYMA